MTFNKTQSRL